MDKIIPILLRYVYINRPLMVLSALRALCLCCLVVDGMLLPEPVQPLLLYLAPLPLCTYSFLHIIMQG